MVQSVRGTDKPPSPSGKAGGTSRQEPPLVPWERKRAPGGAGRFIFLLRFSPSRFQQRGQGGEKGRRGIGSETQESDNYPEIFVTYPLTWKIFCSGSSPAGEERVRRREAEGELDLILPKAPGTPQPVSPQFQPLRWVLALPSPAHRGHSPAVGGKGARDKASEDGTPTQRGPAWAAFGDSGCTQDPWGR